ncbi:hypothetical protein N7493_007393 [Penicillium malachiteum]|uniref:Uncharacterized protein n=1 Tax=Penicillium malachiteum TaxID=1324776 RepID=A0AAD6MUT8_9EURO|nr:hypothetical protein N7493_007393 [Penicillium malachiteum]
MFRLADLESLLTIQPALENRRQQQLGAIYRGSNNCLELAREIIEGHMRSFHPRLLDIKQPAHTTALTTEIGINEAAVAAFNTSQLSVLPDSTPCLIKYIEVLAVRLITIQSLRQDKRQILNDIISHGSVPPSFVRQHDKRIRQMIPDIGFGFQREFRLKRHNSISALKEKLERYKATLLLDLL